MGDAGSKGFKMSGYGGFGEPPRDTLLRWHSLYQQFIMRPTDRPRTCVSVCRAARARTWVVEDAHVSCGSYLLYLLADDHWVVSTDLLRAHLPVVERTLVLVAVPVHRAVEAPASALEPRQADLLTTRGAPVLLFLAVSAVIFPIVILLIRGSGRDAATRALAAGNVVRL